MLPTVSIQLDRQGVLDLDQTLRGIKNGAARAITTGINKTLTGARAEVVRRLAKELELPSKVIRDTITLNKANHSHLEGKVRVSRKPIPLYDFKPTPSQPGRNTKRGKRGRGVSVKVRKGKPREVLKDTFIARMASGHLGIYERKRTSGNVASGPRHGRLPIAERFGPTPAGVLGRAPGVIQDVMAVIGPRLRQEILSQVDRLLKRPKSFT